LFYADVVHVLEAAQELPAGSSMAGYRTRGSSFQKTKPFLKLGKLANPSDTISLAYPQAPKGIGVFP
jgi:hypothetical protein